MSMQDSHQLGGVSTMLPPHHQQHHSSQQSAPQLQKSQAHVSAESIPPPSQSPTSSAGFDNLTCQWLGCGERSSSPEALYDHVCERHVGRKSTNNLNLQCQWGSCRTTTVKRDHITSHVRVHVPLKPHRCDFCHKSFKRPQDLKKHVKTHADESVLGRAGDGVGGSAAQRSFIGGYQPGMSKDQGYYSSNHQGQTYGYAASNQSHFGQNGTPYNYGPVSYQMPQSNGFNDTHMTESRKRQHDALDHFFGDVKRSRVNPHEYADLGAQFGGLQALGLTLGSAFQNGNGYPQAMRDEFGGAGTAYQTMSHAPSIQSQQPMGLPFSNIKTRDDLITLDQFLEQLQNTVYESSEHADMHGHAAHPNVIYTGIDPDLPGSPPQAPSVSGGSTTTESVDSSSLLGTPGSLHPSHSPEAGVTQPQFAQHPHPHMASSGHGYPQLNTISGLSSHMQYDGHYTTASMSSGSLGNPYEDYEGRRYSGGFLQRQKPQSALLSKTEAEDRDSKQSPTKTPLKESQPAKSPSGQDSSPSGTNKEISSAGAESPATASSPTNTPSGEAVEAWVHNMRFIEALRAYMKMRLERGEYEDASTRDKEQTLQRDGSRSPSHQKEAPSTPRADPAVLKPSADTDVQMSEEPATKIESASNDDADGATTPRAASPQAKPADGRDDSGDVSMSDAEPKSGSATVNYPRLRTAQAA